MVTLEARSYGVARYVGRRTGAWMIVNDVAGFIGPEVFRTGEQLERACLEDTVMAKLHGLTMGLDVCSTFHMGIAPAELEASDRADRRARRARVPDGRGRQRRPDARLPDDLLPRAPAAAPTDRPAISSPMQRRLTALGVSDARRPPARRRRSAASLYAGYMKAGGDTRSARDAARGGAPAARGAARARLRPRARARAGLRGAAGGRRAARGNLHARARALYAALDDGVVRMPARASLRARTRGARPGRIPLAPARGRATARGRRRARRRALRARAARRCSSSSPTG